jgi:O-acetyl-ADP-ribose deacetylase (regulator of RNase III)
VEARDGAFLKGRVVASVGDITRQEVGAIVNAANGSLLGGGGVDGAIHAAGGPAILAACRELRRTVFPAGLPTGEAVMTTGGLLPATYVIHTVGPVYGRHQGREAELLASCYQRSIALAHGHRLGTVAFPAISTGAFGYPHVEAARVASRAIALALRGAPGIHEVRLVFYSAPDLAVFLEHQELGAA